MLFSLYLDDSLSGIGMVVLARTNLMAAISLAGTSSLAILWKGRTMTLPVPSRLDLLKSVLALMRSCSHFGSGFDLVSGRMGIESGSGLAALKGGDGGSDLESGAPLAAAVAGGSVKSIDGDMVGGACGTFCVCVQGIWRVLGPDLHGKRRPLASFVMCTVPGCVLLADVHGLRQTRTASAAL